MISRFPNLQVSGVPVWDRVARMSTPGTGKNMLFTSCVMLTRPVCADAPLAGKQCVLKHLPVQRR